MGGRRRRRRRRKKMRMRRRRRRRERGREGGEEEEEEEEQERSQLHCESLSAAVILLARSKNVSLQSMFCSSSVCFSNCFSI